LSLGGPQRIPTKLTPPEALIFDDPQRIRQKSELPVQTDDRQYGKIREGASL
jgi:hypothetical protein